MSKTQTVEVDLEKNPLGFIILVTGEINQELANDVTHKLLEMDFENKSRGQLVPITLLINSPGGELAAAWQICDIMDFIDTPVYTTGVGQIASAALIIFMNGQKGNRVISDRSSIMSHRYSMGLSGSHTDLIAIQPELENIHNRMVHHYAECTGLAPQIIERELLRGHDVWLNPNQAKKYGIADSIQNTKKTKLLRYSHHSLNNTNSKKYKKEPRGKK